MKAESFALSDLHLHIDGSLSLKSLRRLLFINGIREDASDEQLLGRMTAAPGGDLNDYLKLFPYPQSLLQRPEAMREAVYLLLEEEREKGLIYCEIRIGPQQHTKEGMTQWDVVEAAIGGAIRSGFPCTFILSCLRGRDNLKENMETIHLAREYLGKGVGAIDLAGAEGIYKTREFGELFAEAKRLGIPFTVHAGEADGPESVRDAVAFGAKRIGHGVRSYEDPELLDILYKKDILLELCPSSNLDTGVFKNLNEYPLKQYLNRDIPVNINCDNMTVSNTDLGREYKLLADAFDLDDRTLLKISMNSIKYAFCSNNRKIELLKRMEERLSEVRS